MVKGQNLEEAEEGEKKEYKKKQIMSSSFFGRSLCMIYASGSRTMNLLLTSMYVRPASVIRMNFSVEDGQLQQDKLDKTSKSS